MINLPSAQTPLNQHSLGALELWLTQLGAIKSKENKCLWKWTSSKWFAEIYFMQDELKVIWRQENNNTQYSFPYGLPRQDIEAALKHGP